jgi:hypothetical protein
MALFKVVVEAYVASRELDKGSLARLTWWVDVLGDKEIAAISHEDIDAALVKLASRGRLKSGRRMPGVPVGKPLAGSSINRHISQAGRLLLSSNWIGDDGRNERLMNLAIRSGASTRPHSPRAADASGASGLPHAGAERPAALDRAAGVVADRVRDRLLRRVRKRLARYERALRQWAERVADSSV